MVGTPTADQQKGVLNNNSQWDADAHRFIQVDASGALISPTNPLPTEIIGESGNVAEVTENNKLEFKDFQEKMKTDQLVDHYSTVHCMVDIDKFVFVMKSREKWNYYSTMSFEELNRFADNNGIDPVEAFDMFMINYCSHTLNILPPERKELMEEIDDINKDSTHQSPLGNQGNQVSDISCCTPTSPTLDTMNKEADDIISPGGDLIDDAQDYSDFLLKFFDRLEKNVLSSLKKVGPEIEKKHMGKTFGQFLTDMFNGVNTVAFSNQVRRYIKTDLVNGLTSAEAELSLDIGYTAAYQEKLNQLASQQIDGYMIDGKKWFGIKGVTKEIQAQVIQTVQNGINDNKGIDAISKDIQKDFSKFSEWRSDMIARTETTRITNEGKMLGYKESGIEGKKVWRAAIDSRTSPICQRLNGQAVELDDDFTDPQTNKRYPAPPSHSNCRSTISFTPKV